MITIDHSPRHVLQQTIRQHQAAIGRLRIVLDERRDARLLAVLLEMDTRHELRSEIDALDDALEAFKELKRGERMERRLA